MLNITFKNGRQPVLILQILFGVKALLDKRILEYIKGWLRVSWCRKTIWLIFFWDEYPTKYFHTEHTQTNPHTSSRTHTHTHTHKPQHTCNLNIGQI